MLVRVSDYFDKFHCLAGACPHTCCAKWEVVIDEESACRYQAVSGPLGEKLRAHLTKDAEGDFCFPLDGDRCPFLNEQNLCQIHLELGEEATSITCREHPRFTEDYGAFREITLSASCPEANRLLLGSEAPLTFKELESDEAAEEGDEWLAYLLPLRQRMLEILADRATPLKRRLGEFLRLAQDAQDCLNEERPEELPELAHSWKCGDHMAENGEIKLFPEALRFLAGLETLEPDWLALLAQAETAEPVVCPEPLLERIAVYAAFWHLLKTVNDGDLLSRAQLCVLTVLTVERLAAACGLSEALRRFSCEIEHSGENLDALLEACWQSETFSLERFYGELYAN